MTIHTSFADFGVKSWMTILGVPVASIDWDSAVVLVQRLIEEDRFTKITFLNAHNANLAVSDPDFAAALNEFLILPDGIGVDIAAKLLYGTSLSVKPQRHGFRPGIPARDVKAAYGRIDRRQGRQCRGRCLEFRPAHAAAPVRPDQ